MNPARSTCLAGVVILLMQTLSLPTAQGQAKPPDDPKKRKPAIIVFVNGCETSLPNRWKASLDFRIGNKLVAGDIRIGERSPAVLLSKEEAGKVLAYLHDGAEPIANAAIPFSPNAHYVVVASGQLDSSPIGVDLHVASESDKIVEEIGSRSRVVLYNTIRKYPVSVAIGNAKPQAIAPLTESILWEAPGEQKLEIYFPYLKNEARAIKSVLSTESGKSYLLVVHESAERPDRPAITRTNSSLDRSAIEDVQTAVQEAEKQPPLPD